MRSSLDQVVALVMLIGSLGLGYGVGRPRTIGVLPADFESVATADIPRGTMKAERAGQLGRLHVEVAVAGDPGGSVTVQAQIRGSMACEAVFACDAPIDDTTVDCAASTFEADDDIHVVITSNTCLGVPPHLVGSLTFFSE